jgi:hypothetical protein
MQNPVTASAPRRGKAAAVCTLQQGSRLLPAQTRTRASSDTREYARHGSDAVTQSDDRHDAFLRLHNSKSVSCIRIPIYETIGSGSKESPGLIRETQERGKTLLLPELDSRGDAKTHSLGASERGERVAVVHRISVARDCSPREHPITSDTKEVIAGTDPREHNTLLRLSSSTRGMSKTQSRRF